MDAKTLCLGVLSRGAASGYEIKKAFEEGPFSHFHQASFGSIYPTLNALSADGLVAVRPGAAKAPGQEDLFPHTQGTQRAPRGADGHAGARCRALGPPLHPVLRAAPATGPGRAAHQRAHRVVPGDAGAHGGLRLRTAERRVGTECVSQCRTRGAPYN